MAPTKTALYDRSGVCPACTVKSPYADFMSGSYVEEGRETDQHVTQYRWLKPDFPALHPPYYAIAVCPQCGYADFRTDFFASESGQPHIARQIAPLLKTDARKPICPVAAIRKGVRPTPLIDFPMALRLHLLAVAIQELLPSERRDHLKLARLYLRTGWLYREQGGTQVDAPAEAAPPPAWDTLLAGLDEARKAAGMLEPLYAGTPAGAECTRLVARVAELSTTAATVRGRILQAATPDTPLGFLVPLRAVWPNVPAAEAACLEAAVLEFEQVYQRGDADTVALLKIMIDLNYRLQRYDRVLEYAASISKNGYDERLKLQQQLASRNLGTQEENRIVSRMTRITAALDLAAEIRRDVKARQTAGVPA